MPSNQEIINEAVQKALESDGTIDLLLISKTLDDINGEDIGADEDYGMHYNYLYIGMSGQRLVDQMNSNWHATDAQFLAHNNALNIRIKSNQIKEIKVENGIVFYTEDGTTWKSLQSSWGQITGNLSDQTDLKNALDAKVNVEDFNIVVSQVGSNTNSITNLTAAVSEISTALDELSRAIVGAGGVLVRLDDIERVLAKKITSNQVLEIRTINGTALEFTTDGHSWHPVSSAGQVEWGDVIGDIENQADLQLLFKNVNDLISQVSDALEEHISSLENPHQVSKAQVGLGNVDNTSDMDKPVSTAQREAIDLAMANSGFVSLTKAEFEALENKNENTVYNITDL